MSSQTSRQEAIQVARQLISQSPVYLDTETTGLGDKAEIIEISVLDQDGAVLVDTLAKPRGKIPLDAQRIHGITSLMVKDAPEWQEVWKDVEQAISGRLVGIYNSEYDLRLLNQTNKLNWIMAVLEPSQFVCIMKLYAQFAGAWDQRRRRFRFFSLERAGQAAGLTLQNTHRAKDDTLLTRALLHYIAEQD